MATRPHARTRTAGELAAPTGTSQHQDHPLSPSSHPSLTRRPSSVPKQPPDYISATSSNSYSTHDRRKANATDADLLGIGPSRRLGPFKSSSTQPQSHAADAGTSTPMQKSRSKRPWKMFLQSLSREELAVVDTDFDAMTESQLRSYLHTFSTSASASGTPDIIKDDVSPFTSVPPTPPIPIQARSSDIGGSDQPLFPPSPPGTTDQEIVDHPLRILSRAVRELREAVEKLEEENEALRLIKEAGGVRPKRNRQADQLSIHEGLTEALSTSLASDLSPAPHQSSNFAPSIRDTASIRSNSPAPSARRAKSPTPSVRTVPVLSSSPATGTSLYSVRSAEPPPAGSSRRNQNNRSSWTSGLWVWSNGTKPKPARPRKGSVGSVLSNAGTLGDVIEGTVEGTSLDEEEESWRKGDGGSSPAFRAIFLATRIITPDPLSILVSLDIPSTSLIAYLAHSLVSTARDNLITIKDPPGRRRANTSSLTRSRATSVASTESRRAEIPDNSSKGYSDSARSATAAIGRSLFSTVSNATMRAKAYSVGIDDQPTPSRPALLNRASSSRAFPTTAVSGGTFNHHDQADDTQNSLEATTPLPSVELLSIVADENRPPTVLLSRQQLGSYFQSSKAVPTLRTASRFMSSEAPLTDRYGFIYDIQHASMLKDASEAGIAAPAALNGTMSTTGTREAEGEGWIDRQRRKSQERERPTSSRRSTSSLDGRIPSPSGTPRRSLEASLVAIAPNQSRSGTTTPSKDRSSSHPDVQRIRGSSSVSMNPSPPKAVIAKDTLTVSARGSASLHSQVDQPAAITSSSSSRSPISTSLALPVDTVPSTTNSSRTTVSSLLDRLTTLHDSQQKERKREWDTFLRHRKTKTKTKASSRSDTIDNGPGTLGISQMGRGEEWKAFAKLVRAGIPLAYRSDIWAECSGATDMMVPGEYAEIQNVHQNDTSPFVSEIEKDVTRTFPGNVFFGGDGPGVAKLRRVLVAYSWYNPEVGYCQGMNMLAATLLLTHTDEEQAYWTLVSILSRILPQGYFTPDLLSSRADQLVLAELVAQYVPKVHSHLEDLGVDLSSITFGWFLSLFTDCLPVETLFRVWDVFFVEGHDTLFRVAIAILKMNESGITACESVSDLFTLMSGMTARLWSADKLIALQHAYKPIIKHAEIRSKCEKQVAELSDPAS